MLVTSRIAGYADAPLPMSGEAGFLSLELRPFSDEDLREFVEHWYGAQEPDDSKERERGIADLSEALRADSRVRDLARNPMLATLVALVHRYEAHLPGERAKLYELCIKTLIETWPAARLRVAQQRVKNAWLSLFLPALDNAMRKGFEPGRVALYLALGWTQATTTHQWPASETWRSLLGGPAPEHWLPRSQWHLCWLLDDPDDSAHRKALDEALDEGLAGGKDDALIAGALRELFPRE